MIQYPGFDRENCRINVNLSTSCTPKIQEIRQVSLRRRRGIPLSQCALYFIEDAGIKMTVSTDMPAMQLYTGDELRL